MRDFIAELLTEAASAAKGMHGINYPFRKTSETALLFSGRRARPEVPGELLTECGFREQRSDVLGIRHWRSSRAACRARPAGPAGQRNKAAPGLWILMPSMAKGTLLNSLADLRAPEAPLEATYRKGKVTVRKALRLQASEAGAENAREPGVYRVDRGRPAEKPARRNAQASSSQKVREKTCTYRQL